MKAQLSLLAAIAIVGCNSPQAISPETQKKVVTHLSYIRDQHGLCYAVATSYGYYGYETNSIANVPCAAVQL